MTKEAMHKLALRNSDFPTAVSTNLLHQVTHKDGYAYYGRRNRIVGHKVDDWLTAWQEKHET